MNLDHYNDPIDLVADAVRVARERMEDAGILDERKMRSFSVIVDQTGHVSYGCPTLGPWLNSLKDLECMYLELVTTGAAFLDSPDSTPLKHEFERLYEECFEWPEVISQDRSEVARSSQLAAAKTRSTKLTRDQKTLIAEGKRLAKIMPHHNVSSKLADFAKSNKLKPANETNVRKLLKKHQVIKTGD